MTTTSGPELAAIRKALGVTATDLGRAMGYSGVSPHARVFQTEALHTVTPRMAQRYLDGIASLRRSMGQEENPQ